MAVYNGIFNDNVVNPKNIAAYKARRGIMDFTQLGMFDQYESGYSFLAVLEMPRFMTALANAGNTDIKAAVDAFQFMLEYEFRGITGLPDVTVNTLTLTDGANEAQVINDVVKDTSISVSMSFFEKRGSLITKFSEYYLTGIKDPYSKAKTYHGLLFDGGLDNSYRNEVFTMMYINTDNTMTAIEKAVLLCNMQLTKAETSMYDSERGQMGNKELSVEFNCLPIYGYEVDKAAKKLLKDITGVEYNAKDRRYTADGKWKDGQKKAVLDSATYKFGIMDPDDTADSGTQGEAIDIYKDLFE